MTERKQTWNHQPPAIDYLRNNEYAVLHASMGTGKTFIALQNLREFASQKNRRALVLCPSAVLGVWRGEIEKHMSGEFEALILDGSQNSVQKAKTVAEAISRQQFTAPLIVVVNYETMAHGLKTITKGSKKVKVPGPMAAELGRHVWPVMVADELHKLKGYSTNTSWSAWKLGESALRRVGLTGTLMPHGPEDIFGQYRFMDSRIFGTYCTHFRKEYAIMNPYIPNAVQEWINQEQMTEKINLIRHRITNDVLVLPEKHEIRVEVPLSPSATKLYKAMKKDSVAIIKQIIMETGGDREKLRRAVAANPAVKSLRLLQMAQGFTKDDTGEELETDTVKRRALLEMLEGIDRGDKVCVYGWFHHDMAIVRKCCEILGLRYGEVSGNRKDLTPHGKFPEELDVLGVQCKSGSSGIDLTAARIGIVLNTGYMSPGDYDQMMARQYRPGQVNQLSYYFLVTPGTVDEHVYKARQQKRDVNDAILECLEENL